MAEHIEDTSCILCGYPMESLDHLFFQCSVTRQVWMEIKAWLGFTRVLTTLKAAIKWISKEGRGTGVQAIAERIGIACVVYCLWKHRNTRMFEGKRGVAVAAGSIAFVDVAGFQHSFE
ncbi:hypothetical protein Acr_16g0003790 [Actinidia rufa]|uniref:Reverse transcriptase zinc-binding domain-containing protein n=1 Tax=Actinidia rufa TaxID=165716 RepID=A0A7J0FYH9_9ERIC|nr:hypothetical protein Acr_16g0003790 [Actinidia rufa]